MEALTGLGEQIALYGTCVVCVLGNLGTRDFEIIAAEDCPVGPEAQADFHRRGLCYSATMGFVAGRFTVRILRWLMSWHRTTPESSAYCIPTSTVFL